MRLLLRYRTGDTMHPNGDLQQAQVRNILSTLGWLPKESRFAADKLKRVIDLLPNEIRDEIQAGDPVLIAPRPGIWGIVSSENHNEIKIRLIHEDLDTLKSVATTVVDEFPYVFHREFDRDLGFDPEVAIRRFDSEIRIVVGRIEEYHTAGFLGFTKTRRRREGFLIFLLASLAMIAIGCSILMYLFATRGDFEYWRGHLDRASTALSVAALTTAINLYFEFRNWRNDKRRINWGYSDAHAEARFG